MNAFATLTPVLRVLHLFVTLAMIGVVLIQRSEGGGLGIGTTQGMGAFMSGRGTANLLTRTTAILGTLFFGISLALALLNKGTNGVGHDILASPPPLAGVKVPGPAVPGPVVPGPGVSGQAGSVANRAKALPAQPADRGPSVPQ